MCVFFFFFFLATSKRVRQADIRELCHHVMRAGDSSIWLLVFCSRFLSCFFFCFVFFYIATSKKGNED